MKQQTSFDWKLFFVVFITSMVILYPYRTDWKNILIWILASVSIITGIYVWVIKPPALRNPIGWAIFYILLGITEFVITNFINLQDSYFTLFLSLLNAVIIYKVITFKENRS